MERNDNQGGWLRLEMRTDTENTMLDQNIRDREINHKPQGQTGLKEKLKGRNI